MADKPLIYVIAGEESGDLLGGRLMQRLRSLTNDGIEFAGVGGSRMQAQGLRSLFPMTDLSVMGISEVMGRLPILTRRIRQTQRDILQLKPVAVVTIDAPDFSFRVARKISRLAPTIRLVHYIAPSVWAWRPGRAKMLAGFLDHLLAVLPFEPPYFTDVGLACTFVGHPAVEDRHTAEPGAFRAAHGLSADSKIMLLLPGSRLGEVERSLALMIECARSLAILHPELVFVCPTLDHLSARLEAAFQSADLPALIVGPNEMQSALATATLALATSGTVALQLGIAGVPSVICYRATRLTAFIARRLVKLRHVSLINLIMGREIMPEFIQQDATPNRIIPALLSLLEHETIRANQKAAFEVASSRLSIEGKLPSIAAAEAVLRVCATSPEWKVSVDPA